MSETPKPIAVIAQSRVVEGKLDELMALVDELVEFIERTEEGNLGYEWFLNEDKTEITVLEKYASSQAIAFHGANYADYAKRLAELREPISITVLGEVSEELRAMLEKAGAEVRAPVAGFAR